MWHVGEKIQDLEMTNKKVWQDHVQPNKCTVIARYFPALRWMHIF